MNSQDIAKGLGDVILAWAYFAGAVTVIFGCLWLAIYKPWRRSSR